MVNSLQRGQSGLGSFSSYRWHQRTRRRRAGTQCPLGPDLSNSETGPGMLVVSLLLPRVLRFWKRNAQIPKSETFKHSRFQADTKPTHPPRVSVCESVFVHVVVS